MALCRMIIHADLYLDPMSFVHRPYLSAFVTMARKELPGNKYGNPVKLKKDEPRYIMRPIEVQALRVASRLVNLMKFRIGPDYIFLSSPWMDPGDVLTLTDKHIKLLGS